MKVAVVHDWLYVLGGAERVLREILTCYPQADVFALFDILSPEDRAAIGYTHSQTTFLQRMPRISRNHRSYLPLMPLAIEQLDVSGYDLVISSSYAVAKGVITGPDQFHIAYIHSPMRYAWDLQHAYLRNQRGRLGVRNAIARLLLHRLRMWDFCSSQRPNALLANSAFVARRIEKAFGRSATVLYPPVDAEPRAAGLPREQHFVVAGRLVGYKNTRVVVEAFAALPHLELIVAGSGPEEAALRKIATPNVRFSCFVSDAEMRRLMATSRALIFAAEEDFGIVPVEAQAEGTPVIALGRGGARRPLSPPARREQACSSMNQPLSMSPPAFTASSPRKRLSSPRIVSRTLGGSRQDASGRSSWRQSIQACGAGSTAATR